MNDMRPTALIADDEPLLLEALEKELVSAWPDLDISAKVTDGSSAITSLLSGQYDIAFLDIQMPEHNGIEVLKAVTEEWPDSIEVKATPLKAPPLFVFVTAYDHYAIEAFEFAAIDYVVKPVTATRLQNTIERLKQIWHAQETELALDKLVSQVNKYSNENQNVQTSSNWLESVRVSIGDTVHLIPVNDIIMFEASDKYVVVHTKDKEALIRDSLKSLIPRLPPDQFKQIHRSTVVNLHYVEAAKRINGTKMSLVLKDSDQTPVVSRLYRHIFKAM